MPDFHEHSTHDGKQDLTHLMPMAMTSSQTTDDVCGSIELTPIVRKRWPDFWLGVLAGVAIIAAVWLIDNWKP